MTAGEYNNCVDKSSDSVYRFVLKSLRDSEAAKDIVQESFLRLWENREAVVPGKEKSYLFTIAYRLIVDTVRAKSRYINDYEQAAAKHGIFDGGYTNAADIVGMVMDKLPEIQRRLIMLRDYEGYSYKEIAEITTLTESQVKVYIFRARVVLKEKLGKIENII